MKLITIAVPTYNNESTIARTIESCLAQTDLTDVEILVVNNASTDKTNEILQSFGKQIRVITNSETVSLFENHNVALRYAESKYTLFCHSDDVLTDDAILILKTKLAQRGYPRRYICWGHSMFRDYYTSLRNANFSTGQVFGGILAVNPFLNGGLTPSGTCYSSEFILCGGFLPTQHKLAPSDSTSMVNAALKGFRFEMMQDIIFYRTNASTMTRITKPKDEEAGYINAYENFIKLHGKEICVDLLMASFEMRIPPFGFLNFNAKLHPKVVMRRLLGSLRKSPGIALTTSFFRVFFATLRSLLNANKR